MEIDNTFVPFAQVTKVDGKQYSVLTSVRNFALFINTILTKEAEIEKPPETWDEFIDYAKKCTKTDANGNITRLATSWVGKKTVGTSIVP